MVFGADNRPRPALLSLIMLAVLVLSVAAAWLLAVPRQAAYRHAIDILHSLDADTLSNYWATHDDTWFIAYDASGRIGWQGTLLGRAGKLFTGRTKTKLQLPNSPNFIDEERWGISDDLKTTDYTETSPTYKVISRDGAIRVRFLVESPNGIVKPVDLPPGGQGERVDNYLPPCLIELAVARVAKTQRGATFAIVDSSPFVQHQPALRMLNLAITPAGPHTVQVTLRGDTDITYVYILAADGDISEIQDLHGRITFKRATRQDVEKDFPDDVLPDPAPVPPVTPKEETPANSDGGE
jgi:hypothetical protein